MVPTTAINQPPNPEQHAVADALLGLNCHLTKDWEKERYITLEVVIGKSKKNKNAISIFADKVSFMVTDWSCELQAKSLGLGAVRSKRYRRLIFPGLTREDIARHSDFFLDLTREAFRESQMLQGYSHFAGSIDQLILTVNGETLPAHDVDELRNKYGAFSDSFSGGEV